jgi:hypothetical protein
MFESWLALAAWALRRTELLALRGWDCPWDWRGGANLKWLNKPLLAGKASELHVLLSAFGLLCLPCHNQPTNQESNRPNKQLATSSQASSQSA